MQWFMVIKTAAAGEFDRRITIEVATKTRDASNDEIPGWAEWPHGRRWARKREFSGRENVGAQQVVRESDTSFTLRWDRESLTIAPESHRVLYGGAIYEIVAIGEATEGRRDTIVLLCASRPDLVGARGRDTTSEGSP